MNNLIQTIVAIPFVVAVLFLAFVYLPALLSKATNTTMRTRGIINTKYSPDNFDTINDTIMEQARSMRRKFIQDEYKRILYDIDHVLITTSSYGLSYSEYKSLEQEFYSIAVSGGASRSQRTSFVNVGNGRVKAAPMRSYDDRTSQLLKVINNMEQYYKGVHVETIVDFVKGGCSNRTSSDIAILDRIPAENFKPLEVIIERIYEASRRGRVSTQQVSTLRETIGGRYMS